MEQAFVPPPARSPPIALLAAISACGPLAINIFLPALPTISAEMHAGPSQMQWTISLFFIGVSLGQLVYGPISDVYGRRGAVLGGIAIYALSCFGCYFAQSIDVLIWARFSQAMGGCVGMVISRAVIKDIFPGQGYAAALSTVLMVSAIAPMLGPSLGGIVIVWVGWREIFLILGLSSGLLLVLCWRYLGETNLHRQPSGHGVFIRAYWEVLGHRTFLLYAVSNAAIQSAYYAFMSGAPYLVISQLHWSPSDYGLLAMIAPAGFICGNGAARRLSVRLSSVGMVLTGVSVTAVGLALSVGLVTALPLSAYGLFLPMAVVSFGHGLTFTSAISLAMSVVPDFAGSSSAVAGCVQMLVAALISKIAGGIVNISPSSIIFLMAFVHVSACIIFLYGVKMDRRKL